MQTDLNLNNAQSGMLASLNLAGYLTMAVIGGALAARFGPRTVITAGLILAGAGMILTGLMHDLFYISAWRVLTGVGSGASNVPVMALLPAWFAAKRRGLASGIAVTGSSLGLIVVGPLVPRMLEIYGNNGWHVSWYIFGGITLAVAVLSGLLLRNHPSEKGMTAIGAEHNAPAPASQSLGLEWGRVYRSFAVWHLGLVYVAFGFSYMIYMTFFTKRLIAEGGFTSAQAGSLFMTMGWISLICGLLWGTVSDIIGRKGALIIVYLIHAVAFTLFGLGWFNLSMLLFGISAWSIPAIMAATCGDVLGPRLAPAALGFITLFFGIGQALGPSVAGMMADASGGFTSSYILAGCVALLGALGASLIRPVPASQET
jgi:MFS family permease